MKLPFISELSLTVRLNLLKNTLNTTYPEFRKLLDVYVILLEKYLLNTHSGVFLCIHFYKPDRKSVV